MVNESLAVVLFVILAAIHPHSAIGAVFGCCFYLAMPNSGTAKQTILLTVFSAGVGYGAGVSIWANESSLLVSAIVSALIVVLLTSAQGIIKERLMDLISLLINLRK